MQKKVIKKVGTYYIMIDIQHTHNQPKNNVVLFFF